MVAVYRFGVQLLGAKYRLAEKAHITIKETKNLGYDTVRCT